MGAMSGPLDARVKRNFDWRSVVSSLPKDVRERSIAVHDFGAFSGPRGMERRCRVGSLEESASTDRRKALWLAAFASSASAGLGGGIRILELGTCLGAGAVSLVLGARGQCSYVGMEGSPDLAGIAAERIRHAAPDVQVDMRVGPFRETLPVLMDSGMRFDLVFLDGHHEGQALLEQWHRLRPRLNRGAWVVVDDIRWSVDMHAAWKELAGTDGVMAFDLFRMGALRYSGTTIRTPGGQRRVPLPLFA